MKSHLDIGSVPTREEAEALWRRARSGDMLARNELVQRNMRLVVVAANKMAVHTPHIPIDDLIQEGAIGLMRAVDHWEPTKGALSTCADFWIRQALQYARKGDRLIHIPANVFHQPAKMAALDESGVLAVPLSLDAPLGQGDGDQTTLGEWLVAPEDHSGDERATLAMIDQAPLNPRDREVLWRRYMLAQSLAQIGHSMGIGRERVRQLETRALRVVRAHLEGDGIAPRRVVKRKAAVA